MALTSARAQSGAKRPCAGVSPCAHVMRPARVALWWHACYSRACARCLFRDVTSTGERHFPPLSLARISRAGGSSPSLCLPDADVFIIFVSFVVIFCSRSRAPPRWNGAEASVAASRRLWRVPFSRLILCASFEQSFTARACERLPDEKACARCQAFSRETCSQARSQQISEKRAELSLGAIGLENEG